ncbi:MAG: VOC family protein [Actinomycetota bacterium]
MAAGLPVTPSALDPVGRLREVVLDAPDPHALARFWAAVLGGEPLEWYPGWVTLEPPPGPRVSFQASAGQRPRPARPGLPAARLTR